MEILNQNPSDTDFVGLIFKCGFEKRPCNLIMFKWAKSGKTLWSPWHFILVYFFNYVQFVSLWKPHWFLRIVRPSTNFLKVRKRAKIRNRYNQAPHLTQDTNGKLTTSKLDITNKSPGVSPFPAGDHKV